MKSIFLLCEYGIPVNTIQNIDKQGINFEDIQNDINCLDKCLGEYSDKKIKIENAITKIEYSNKEYSIYELAKYGLSKNIIDKLFFKHIELEDINEDIKEEYHIGESTYAKINIALNKFINDRHINFGLTSLKVLRIINRVFEHNSFQVDDLITVIEKEGYNSENIENMLSELIKSKRIVINNNKYKVPYSVYDLERYGLSGL